MNAFASQNGYSRVRLDSFVKKISIDVIHIDSRNKAGKIVPRIKTIMSLARRDDGRRQSNPLIISELGAGSKDIKFFVANSAPKSSQKSRGRRANEQRVEKLHRLALVLCRATIGRSKSIFQGLSHRAETRQFQYSYYLKSHYQNN